MASSGFEVTEWNSSFGKSCSTLNVSSKRANHTLSESAWFKVAEKILDTLEQVEAMVIMSRNRLKSLESAKCLGEHY